MSYIGEKKIKGVIETGEKTHGGEPLVRVEFKDGTAEFLAKKMCDATQTEKAVDLTVLRDRRMEPVLTETLALLRDWGVKIGELQYFSARLNQSLDENSTEAMRVLWSQHMPKPKELDDVDFVTIDRVLRNRKVTAQEVLNE